MSDVNANINISIDSSQALAQLRALQNQISTFNQSVVAGNVAAAAAQRDMTRNLTAQINASKGFTTSMVNVESSVSRLGKAIDKNRLSLGEYFRYGAAASGTFGKRMREHADIMDLAADRAKRLQTQYIATGQAQNGMVRAMAVRPTQLFNADAAVGIQRQQIFNKLLNDGSTSLVNWGKNTQWAGRQLMVGFTVPLTIFGGIAGKIFMDLEKQVVQFKRVYGDLQTPASERNAMVQEIQTLSKEFTKYGISVTDTMALAAKAAATGAQGADLIAATTEATRLATLGQIDYQQALDATISLQTAFNVSSRDLADTTNFLNAVENQTVTSLDDITQAIPLVAPVIKGLGGDVKDLAIFLTAMREGGVSANEGANALKSGLASLINPTKAAREQLEKVGINIDTILSKNKGDIRGLVMEFGEALNGLSKFERQQTLAKTFGKYQFARLGALFQNISKDGTQAARAIDLTTLSAKELADIAQGELGQLEQAVGVKFTAAMEKLKLAIAPIGEAFLKIATPIIEFVTKIADKFNELPDAAKTFITWAAAIGGVLVPSVIMLVGLLGNFIGNMIKIGLGIRRVTGRLSGLSSAFQYLSNEELDAAAAAASLEGATTSLTSSLNVQRNAVSALARAYGSYVAAAGAAAANLPQGFRGPMRGPVRRMATGGTVPGSGNGDTVPAMLTPGETVVTKEATQKYGPVLAAMNAGTLRGFARGVINLGGDESVSLGLRAVASSKLTIERLLAAATEASAEVGESFKAILRNIERAQADVAASGEKVKDATLKDIRRMVVDSGDPALLSTLYGKNKPGGELRYNASSAGIRGSVQEGITRSAGLGFMSAGQAQAEIQRVAAASEGAQAAVREYYDGLLQDVRLTSVERERLEKAQAAALASAEQQHRAHTVQISNFEKTFAEAWDPRLWMGQAGSENQLSNILAQSSETRDLYEAHLRDLVADTSQADDIMRKVNTNIALTEEELQVQAQVLRRMLGTTTTMAQVAPNFAGAAVGAVGAAEARASMPGGFFTVDTAELREQAQRVAVQAKDETIMAWRRTWAISSPSEVAASVTEEIPRGAALGIERATPVATAAAVEMAQETISATTKTYLAGADRVTAAAREALLVSGQDLGTPQVPALAAQQLKLEKAARQEEMKTRAAAAATNKEIAKRAMILQRAGIPAQAAVARARQELEIERQILAVEREQERLERSGPRPPVAGTRSGRSGATGVPVGVPVNTTDLDGPLDGVADEANRTKGRFSKLGGKVMGAAFAMDGLVFAASMMDNSMGQFAQKVMPAVFGLQGIAMMAQMLGPMSPLGAGIAVAAAAIAATGLAMWKLNDNTNELRDSARKMNEAMLNNTTALNDTAAFYNRTLVKTREEARSMGTDVESLTKGQEYLQTDVGKRMMEGFSLAMSKMGKDAATKQFATKLGSMVMQGAISAKEARGIANALESELGMAGLSAKIKGKLVSLIGKDGTDITKKPMTVAVRLQAQNDLFSDGLNSAVDMAMSQPSIQNAITDPIGNATKNGLLTGIGVVGGPMANIFTNVISGAVGSALGDTQILGGVGRNILNFVDPQWAALTTAAHGYGQAVSLIATDNYAVLNAAQARYNKLQRQAREEDDPKKKKELVKQLREQEEALKAIKKTMAEAREEAAKTFSERPEGLQDEMLLGMEQALEEQFKDSPEAAALAAFLGSTKEVGDKTARFTIETLISSGQLSPSVVAGFLNNFDNPTEGVATLKFMLDTGTPTQTQTMMLNILGMKNDELRKKAIIDLIVNTPGGLDQETLSTLDPEGETSSGLGNPQAAADAARNAARAANDAYQKAEAEYRDRQSSQDPEVMTARNGLNQVNQTISEWEKVDDSDPNKEKALNAYYQERARLIKELTSASAEEAAAIEELNRLKDVAAQKDREAAIVAEEAMGATQARWRERQQENAEALIPLRNEFWALQDTVEEISKQDITLDITGMPPEKLERVNKVLQKISKLPPKLLKKIDVNSTLAEENLKFFEIKWNEIKNEDDLIEKNIGLNSNQFNAGLNRAGLNWNEFNALPNIQKSLVMTYMTAYITAREEFDSLQEAANAKEAFEAAGGNKALIPEGYAAREAWQDVVDTGGDLEDSGRDYTPDDPADDNSGADTPSPEGSGGGGGGGGDKDNPWETLRKNLLNQIRMYADSSATLKDLFKKKYDFLGLLVKQKGIDDKIRALGLSPGMTEYLMGLEPDQALKVMKQITAKDGTLNAQGRRVEEQMMFGSISEQMNGMQVQARQQAVQRTAFLRLQRTGAAPDAMEAIAGDADNAERYLFLVKQRKQAQDEYNEAVEKGVEGKKLAAIKERWDAAKESLQEYLKGIVQLQREEEAFATAMQIQGDVDRAVQTTDVVNDAAALGFNSPEMVSALSSGNYTSYIQQGEAARNALPKAQKELDKLLANPVKKGEKGWKEYQAAVEAAKKKVKDAEDAVKMYGATAEETLSNIEKGLAAQEWNEFTEDKFGYLAEKAQEAFDNVSAMFEQDFIKLEDQNAAQFLATYGVSKEGAEEIIQDNEIILSQYKEQLTVLENKNEVEQMAITLLEREKKQWNDNIDKAQKSIDAYQKTIDGYQRTVDLNNHQMDLLSHDLDQISDKEAKINEAYQKKIDALDEIAKINDYLISQQENQLGLAEAMSRGDVYAAAQAQAAMQKESVSFATDRMRSGLEDAKDNQINALTNSQGLTRDQIEERMASFREQNYQLGLLIYQQEENIYLKNQEILTYKDQIAAVDERIKVHTDAIFFNEGEILKIQQAQQPLIHDNELWGARLETSEKLLEDAKSDLLLYGMTIKQMEEMNRRVQTYLKAQKASEALLGGQLAMWEKIGKAIVNAREVMEGDLGAIARGDYAAIVTPGIEQFLQEDGSYDITKLINFVTAEGWEQMSGLLGEGIAGFAPASVAAQGGSSSQTGTGSGGGVQSEGTIEDNGRLGPNTWDMAFTYNDNGKRRFGQSGKLVNGFLINTNNWMRRKYDKGVYVDGSAVQVTPFEYGYARGGSVLGNGSMDSISARLTPGEFVMRKAAVNKYGLSTFEKMNMGSFAMPRYNMGESRSVEISGGSPKTSISAPVYNSYSISVPVTNPAASADEIANKVITRIRGIEASSIRRVNGYQS